MKKYIFSVCALLTIGYYFISAQQNNTNKVSNIQDIESSHKTILIASKKEPAPIQQINEQELITNNKENFKETLDWEQETPQLIATTIYDYASSREAWVEKTSCENGICSLIVSASSQSPSIKMTAVNMMAKLKRAEWNSKGQVKLTSMNTETDVHTFSLSVSRDANIFSAPIVLKGGDKDTMASLMRLRENK